MHEIQVRKQGEGRYEVTVHGRRTTSHQVAVPPDHYLRLTSGAVTEEVLVEKSFEFLLERESNTSIMSQFDLPVIGSYFPEYEAEMVRRL